MRAQSETDMDSMSMCSVAVESDQAARSVCVASMQGIPSILAQTGCLAFRITSRPPPIYHSRACCSPAATDLLCTCFAPDAHAGRARIHLRAHTHAHTILKARGPKLSGCLLLFHAAFACCFRTLISHTGFARSFCTLI